MNELLPRIKRLVADECANHQRTGPEGLKDFCWMREKSNAGKCVFFTGKEMCGYFEKSVLPLNPDLEEDYKNERTESRDLVVGEEPGKIPGNISVFSPKNQVERMPLSEDRRKGVLSGTGINDLDSSKLPANHRRRTSGVATEQKEYSIARHTTPREGYSKDIPK